MANLLNLGKITQELKIVFDSGIDNAFYIIKDDGSYIVFNTTRDNLYSLTISDEDEQECCYIRTVKRIFFLIGQRLSSSIEIITKNN